MFKGLRRRFILINLSLLLAVLLAIFAGIFLLMERAGRQESLFQLERLLGSDGSVFDRMDGNKFKPGGQTGQGNRQTPSQMTPEGYKDWETGLFHKLQDALTGKEKPNNPFGDPLTRNSFLIKVDGEGTVTQILSNLSLSDEDGSQELAEEAGLLAAAAERETGTLSLYGMELRYLKSQGEDGVWSIAFLDRSREISTLRQLILVSLIIGAFSLAAVLGISVVLAAWAVKPVEAAWKRQKEFVADASHELKTPLTAIAANLDLVLSNPEDRVGQQRRWLEYVREETARMGKLVSSLLYLAKVDGQEAPDAPERQFCPVNLSDSVEEACLPLESAIFEAGRQLEMEIQPAVFCQGNGDSLRQVTAILLDNALKNAWDGSVISVSLRQERGRAVLTVSNWGREIPLQDRERIFERFYRADKSRDRQTGGFGLGLAIAKSIVEQHRGSISVSCRPLEPLELSEKAAPLHPTPEEPAEGLAEVAFTVNLPALPAHS